MPPPPAKEAAEREAALVGQQFSLVGGDEAAAAGVFGERFSRGGGLREKRREDMRLSRRWRRILAAVRGDGGSLKMAPPAVESRFPPRMNGRPCDAV